MSKIDRLSILGVRSFGNVHQEVIRFNTPLTLIVGYNGSGKTTIIECLKFATTGQLPPNSKNGVFVHDPKLCGEKEVLGQVKLGFTNTAQKRMIVTRSMQLTVQKSKRTFKTLECSLMLTNDGERIAVSSRVAELNLFMPQYFGVSEAILNSVIFCHQDESLWPMSEPTALKKQFDEIFEAMKYTKAIDNLKNLRKVKMSQLGELKAVEAASKEIKDKAEQVQKRSLDLESEIEVLRVQSKDLSDQMEMASATAKGKHSQANKALSIVDTLNTKKDRANATQTTIDELRIDLDELEESDEWLSSTLAQYNDRMAQYQQQDEEYRTEYHELQQSMADSRRQMSNKQAERGQHLAEKERYESQIQARIQLVKQAAHRHAMRGYDGDLDEMQVREFINRVQKLSRDKDRELERVQTSNEDELKQTQAALTDLESRRSTRTQDKVTARQTMAANDKKSKGIQQDLDSISIDEGARAVLEESRNIVQDRLARATTDFDAASWDEKLRTENNGLRELESESERLREELVQNTRLAKDRAQLDFIKGQVKERQQSLDTLKSTYYDQLSTVLRADWSINTVEREFQAVLDQRSRSLEDAKKQQEGAARELSELEYKLKSVRSSLQQKKADMKSCHDAVIRSIKVGDEAKPLSSIDDYEQEFENLQDEYDAAKTGAEGSEYVGKFYQQCLTQVNQGSCKLCMRAFSDKKDKSRAAEKLKDLIAKYAETEFKAAAEDLKQDLQVAIAARSQYDQYGVLSSKEVPALEKELEKIDREKTTLVSRLEHQDNIVTQEESAKSKLESLSKTITTLSRYRKEICDYDSEISRLASQQKLSGSSRTVEEIEEQNTACGERIRGLKSKINKMVAHRDLAKGAMSNLELELSTASRKLDTATHQLERKQNLLSQFDEFRASSNQLQEAIQSANTDLESLVPQFAKAKARHEDVQHRGRTKAKDIQGEKEKLSQTVHEFKVVEDEINGYLDRDGPGKLAACQRAIKLLEQDQKRFEKEAVEVTAMSNDIKKRITDSERTKRSIQDNLRYRKSLRALEVLNTEIAELESRNVTDDYERLNREAINADKRYQHLLAERGPVLGSMKSKDEELARYLEEWDADYKDAGQRYREAHIKVETTKAATEDLGKCIQAVDAAVMKYHSAKMEEINRVAGELWQSTYQGTDVDTIMIRSESEEGSKKRGYNYRVVMVKQDAEMDMRGRCSAGQKVLACIIIRLALAECFGVNCGIIALDEPTTNLDSDNIRALADSLHRIIKQRQQQANFQIIVITHDEDFLKQMRCQEFCDTYYRVSRNEKQKSIIERQSIDEVMRS